MSSFGTNLDEAFAYENQLDPQYVLEDNIPPFPNEATQRHNQRHNQIFNSDIEMKLRPQQTHFQGEPTNIQENVGSSMQTNQNHPQIHSVQSVIDL